MGDFTHTLELLELLLSQLKIQRVKMRPLGIIKPNFNSSEVEIYNASGIEFTNVLTEISDPESAQFISSDYLRVRLLQCVARVRQQVPVSHCPVTLDSWTLDLDTFDAAALASVFPELGYSASREAVKWCGEDGLWWRHPLSNR